MTSYFKAFGLALIAAFALSALAASGASAVEHHFVGEQNDPLSAAAENHQVYKATTNESEGYFCGEVNVNGKVEEATQTSVTVEPEYSNCETFEGEPKTGEGTSVTVNTNGCHFQFTGVTTTGNPTEGDHASVHIICPEEEAIEIRVTELKLKCSDIGTQTIKHAVRYKNETTTGGDGNTHVTVEATAHGIVSKTTGFACGEGTHTNGSYTGNVTVTAPSGVSISSTP